MPEAYSVACSSRCARSSIISTCSSEDTDAASKRRRALDRQRRAFLINEVLEILADRSVHASFSGKDRRARRDTIKRYMTCQSEKKPLERWEAGYRASWSQTNALPGSQTSFRVATIKMLLVDGVLHADVTVTLTKDFARLTLAKDASSMGPTDPNGPVTGIVAECKTTAPQRSQRLQHTIVKTRCPLCSLWLKTSALCCNW